MFPVLLSQNWKKWPCKKISFLIFQIKEVPDILVARLPFHKYVTFLTFKMQGFPDILIGRLS
jgi:hypothetical protein